MRVDSSTSADSWLQARQAVQQQAVIAKLAATDTHVRAHEQAHLAAAGRYARGGASYTYTRGPDGQLYAVGGEVGIDTSPVKGDPEATIRKAEVVRAAAEAPSDPSAQDRTVAAQAARSLVDRLVRQRARPRILVRIGQVQRLAVLAAVDLGALAELLRHLGAEEVPPLQMSGAQLALIVLLVAGAHPEHAALHLRAIAQVGNQ
jgi:hypothetical protein